MSKKQPGHKIKSVEPGSIAEELGIESGDVLLSIDGEAIEDVLDYRLRINSESMVMLIEKPDGEQWEFDIEHGYEDPGLEFESGLMSEYRSCTNKCIFCFIDQMPEGMRDTLYFKDDDSRLSFLQGNYVTLTNMKDHDIDRIVKYRLAPINISIHTTNPELRVRMLHNRFAGESLKYIDRLFEEEIPMNGQIVLCPGWNDSQELERTLKDIMKWAPVMESVSVVPVGLTKFREGLEKLELVTRELAEETIDLIEKYQKLCMEKYGIRLFHASDEFYLLAERELPQEDTYEGYLQLENGVGMLRLLLEESEDAIRNYTDGDGIGYAEEEISIATGRLAYPVICRIANRIMEVFPQKKVHVYEIVNDFFGPDVTVSGLLTGHDVIAQLKGKKLGSRLLLPVNMFRSGEETFLDDLTREDAERELGTKVVINESSGYSFVDAIMNTDYSSGCSHGEYELYDTEVDDE